MKAAITLVTIVCGTALLLSPALFSGVIDRAIDAQFFVWAQIVGGAMCSSGVALAFMLMARSDSAASASGGSRTVAA